jgi:hypothetical protein
MTPTLRLGRSADTSPTKESDVILSKYRVGIGDLLLGASDEETGAHWVVEDLKGWQNPTSTGTVTQRSAARGGWRNRAHLAPRGLTLVGSVYTSLGNAPDLLDSLLENVPLDIPEYLTVYGVHFGQDRVIAVRQEGEASTAIISPTEAAFSIGLVADDPLKYSVEEHVESTRLPVTTGGLTVPVTVPFSIDAVTVSGVVAAFNAGTESTPTRLIIHGGTTGVDSPKVTHLGTGESLQLTMDLAPNEWMDLDLDRHTAMLNGTSSRRGYVTGQWFSLAKGDNLLAFNSPNYSADAELQVVWRDAWK